jgi:eukaryotic-like serine/threonine-protein kinase
MAYCQECGSEVAQIDVYCPFCGIALPAQNDEITSEVISSPVAEEIKTAEAVVSENPADEDVTPAKKPVSAISNFFNSEIEEVDPTAVTVVERTKKKVETVEEAEVVEAAKADEIEPIVIEPASEPEESADIKEEIELKVVAEQEAVEPEIEAEAESEIVAEIEQKEIAEVADAQTFEKPEVTEIAERFNVPEAVEIAERFNVPKIADLPAVADFDERNFDEEFDKLTEHPNGEIATEIDSESADIEPQTVENSDEKTNPQVQLDPFESTVTYTPTDVKDLNLSASEVEVAAENEPEVTAENEPEVVEVAAENEPEVVEDKEQNIVPESSFEDLNETDESESNPKIFETESVLESAIPVAVAPLIGENVAKEEVKERFTSHVGEAVDTGGGKSKLKPLSEGTVLNGRYEIVRKIGGGGMGAVYLASDRNLGGVLRAVKEMVQSHIEEAHQDKAVNDFKRESLLLTSLEHPSIPTIYDYFFDDRENRFYLVMKYISGGDLAGRLRSAPENRLDEKTITEWAIQVADVLDYLHSREPPIVYRDLKPSNVMIDGNSGRVMLIDFGIARWVSAKEEKGVTAVGTMGYAPPELFSGNVEPRSDIYSLGSTMFHLLTGADPQNSPLLIFDFNKNPRPRQIASMLSDQIEQILLRSVEYDADKRFASAAELREVLINHLDNIRTGKLTFGVNDGISAVGFIGGQMVFCGFCGQKIVSSDMFCPFCGAKQATGQMSASSPIPQSVYNVPSIIAKLRLIGTSDLDSVTYNLEKDNNLIGRRDPMSNIFPEVDLSKYDPQTKISRRHSRLWREGDTFMVEDLGSSNGTILLTAFNEQLRLLPHQPRVIAHGDKIKIGDTTLHFVIG